MGYHTPAVRCFVVLLPLLLAADSPGNWPQFRGPAASGHAAGAQTAPITWSLDPPVNVKLNKPIPGLAHSSPIVWGDRIFITTAVPKDPTEYNQQLKIGLYGDIDPVEEKAPYAFQLLCLDRVTGQLLWTQTAREGIPKTKRHPKSSHASATPATDGEHVVAFFGSEGLYCYDFSGNLVWSKDLGVLDAGFFRMPTAQWGFASSPVIHDGKVIVQCDTISQSFLAAFDVANGKELWRTARHDVPTWSTPAVLTDAQRPQIVCNGYKEIAGYDPATGKQLWKMAGGGDIPVPTPVFSDDLNLIFITNAHGPAAPVYAIRSTAKGDISLKDKQAAGEHVAWSVRRGGNYMQTPLLVDNLLYCCADNGLLTCYDAKTGEVRYRQKLAGASGGGFSASGIYADHKLYFTAEDGTVHVVESGPQFKLLATNSLGEPAMATPAALDGVLYFRTRSHLLAVSAP
jgi:outer membrane protein assembly factor BamB